MDKTQGLLTTHKVQSLIDAKLNRTILNRRDLQIELCARGEKISRHGVEAWFRRRDSNLPIPRPSLTNEHISFKVPRKWWRPLLEVFDSANEVLSSDDLFQSQCFQLAQDRQIQNYPAPTAMNLLARSHEVDLLNTAYDKANSGSFSMLYFEGEAGIGKSKIVEAFREHLSRSNIVSLLGVCMQGNNIPLLPLLAMIKMNQDQLTQLNPSFKQFVNDDFSALQSDSSGAPNTPAFFLDLAVHLCDLARNNTVVMVFDDVHWMDEMTCRFVDFFIRHLKPLKNVKLLLVCCARPGVPEPFPYQQFITDESFALLRSFDKSDIASLISGLTALSPASELIDLVWASSRGNPQHAAEFFRHLQNEKLIAATETKLRLNTTGKPIDFPDSLSLLNKSLIDQLDGFSLEVVQICAVIDTGTEIDQLQILFPKRSLRAIVRAIAEAEEHGILQQRGDQFEFSHPLMRSTVYKDMTGALRAERHMAVAGLIKSASYDATNSLQMLSYANHIVAARGYITRSQLARTCYEAAILCRRISAWELVLKYADIALIANADELSDDEKLQLQQFSITGLHQRGEHQKALSQIVSILERTEGLEPLVYAAALNEKVRIKRNYGLYTVSDLADVNRLEKLSKGLESLSPPLAFDVYITLSTHYLYESKSDEALAFALCATKIPGGESYPGLKAKAYVNAAMVNLSTLNLRDALSHFSASRTQAYIAGSGSSGDGDASQVRRTLQRMIIVQLTMGRCSEAQRTLTDLQLPNFKRLSTGEETITMTNQMCLAVLNGESEMVHEKFNECISTMKDTGYAWSSRQVIAWYAAFQCKQKNEQAAREAVNMLETEPLFSKLRPTAKTIPLFNALIDLALRDGDVALGQTRYEITQLCRERPKLGQGVPSASNLNLCANYLSLLVSIEDKQGTAELLPALVAGYAQGAAITLDWPVCVPMLISKSYHLLGNVQEAIFFNRLGRELLARENLSHFL